jgi:hypothetical protein
MERKSIMKIKKLIVLLLFTIAIISIVTPVNAVTNGINNENKGYTVESKEKSVKWKKYDSGSFIDNKTSPGYKKKILYVGYFKGSNSLRIDFYEYTTKNNKKESLGKTYVTKKGNQIGIYVVDKGLKSGTEYYTYKKSLKQYYREFKRNVNS